MDLRTLPWLPSPPDDFRARCRALDPNDGGELRALASHALDLNQLNSLAKAVDRMSADGNGPNDLIPLRVAVLGNTTTTLLLPALVGSGIRHGLLLEVAEAPFDQSMQSALDPNSEIRKFEPDVALLAFDHRVVRAPDTLTDTDDAHAAVARAIDDIRAIRDGLAESGRTTVIFQTIPPPPAPLLGSYDSRLPGSTANLASEFNRLLIELVESSDDLLLDTKRLADTVGLSTWHDATQWHHAKLSFSQSVVPLYADHVARLLTALKGNSRKCLVLDLDNTLWGGVIGDDGLGGIALGQGDGQGEAFLDIQKTAKQLRAHGIILAVSSKNEDDVARLPFREHPDMLLKESDIAAFQANWSDKATNLEAIAKTLDIGTDSLVLLDDNPAERAQVRQALPEVAVPELPDDPAHYPEFLLAAGYFETLSLSGEDLLRADDYAARAKRIELQGEARDLTSYLESLEMEIEFSPFDETGRARIAQLINKSNQFNLTTRRYTENEIARMETDAGLFTLQVRLRDRFGDNGMISVVICRHGDAEWEIDTWLMSCRVLGRGVEQAVLTEIVENAAASKTSTLKGVYIPSGRNALVQNHYSDLGFTQDGADWRLDIPSFVAQPVPMKVRRPKDAAA